MDFVLKHIVPFVVEHPIIGPSGTKVLQDIGCPICKVGVASTQVFNTNIFKSVSSEGAVALCDVIELFAGKSTSICRGVITDMYTE